jgi:hypothetical protein
MRGVSKQNAIKRVRLKLIKIFMFQNKSLASKRLEVRDRRLATKAKLKGGQMQNRAQEDPIRNIASSANSISLKAPRSPISSSIVLSISTRVRFFRSTTPFYLGMCMVENC